MRRQAQSNVVENGVLGLEILVGLRRLLALIYSLTNESSQSVSISDGSWFLDRA
jgi:hypothetical protein